MTQTVPLFAHEAAPFPSVSTVTFFEGKAPMDYLQDRVNEITVANPWLAGTVCKDEGEATLRYEADVSDDAKCIIKVESVADVHLPIADYTATSKAIEDAGMLVDEPAKLINSGLPVFKISVLGISDGGFALVMSLSHIVGDGHTYYRIYNMLSTNCSVLPMIVGRNPNFISATQRAMGVDEAGVIFGIGPYAKTFQEAFGRQCQRGAAEADAIASVGTEANAGLAQRSEPKLGVWEVRMVDADWISREKVQHKERSSAGGSSSNSSSTVPFISTNDILTSW